MKFHNYIYLHLIGLIYILISNKSSNYYDNIQKNHEKNHENIMTRYIHTLQSISYHLTLFDNIFPLKYLYISLYILNSYIKNRKSLLFFIYFMLLDLINKKVGYKINSQIVFLHKTLFVLNIMSHFFIEKNYPFSWLISNKKLFDLIIIISNFGSSFVILHTQI